MPMMPSRLPQMRWPSIQVGDQPAHSLSPVSTAGAFREPARHREDQRHGHVGGVLGQHARRVGHRDAALQRARDVDIVDAVAEIGDQLQLLARLRDHRGVDAVGDGRHQHVGGLHGLGELGLAHRLVVEVEPRVEQLAHPRLDGVRQLARDDDQRLLALSPFAASVAPARRHRNALPDVQAALTASPTLATLPTAGAFGPSLTDGRAKTKQPARAASQSADFAGCTGAAIGRARLR